MSSASKCVCIIHLPGVSKEGAQPFTKVRWDKCKEVALEWSNLDGDDKLIADSLRDNGYISLDFDAIDESVGFHPACYRNFTNIKRIRGAIKRCEKRTSSGSGKASPSQSSTIATTVPHSPPTPPLAIASPKRLRSGHSKLSSSRETTTTERKSILPDVCIICKKSRKMIKVGRNFKTDELRKTETLTAGNLLRAAEQKKDENVLLHIRGQDCVAIEVKYHGKCYRDYVRFLRDPSSNPQPNEQISEADPLNKTAYDKFCEDNVRCRIIKNGEVLRMAKLTQLYNNTDNATILRTDKLKAKLIADFPQLNFYVQSRQDLSELVYCVESFTRNYFENLQSSTETETTESESTGEGDFVRIHRRQVIVDDELKVLYEAGLILRNAIHDKAGMKSRWPPVSSDFTEEATMDVIPIALFNLLAWMTNSSEEPTITNFVRVVPESYPKLMSICQDVVYFSSRGRKQTPKSLALGMATKHLTGSSQLLTMLNRFGHCSSKLTILGLETSLAELQLTRENAIPQGFVESKPIILVWDNIDFGEETLSGKGTTHHTNGILVQNNIAEVEVFETRTETLPKGKRTFKPKPSKMYEYHMKRRSGPQSITSEIPLGIECYINDLTVFSKLDTAFSILKHVLKDRSDPLPGWTGFNCLMNIGAILPQSSIYYMPVIEASPTELTTVNTVLIRSIQEAEKFKLKNVLVVFDQSIYAKAQQIRWNNPEFKEKIIIRLGEFHTCMAFLGMIGKVFKDAGLQDIIIESGIVAQGSINGVISGHHYNRSIRSHKLICEALERMRFGSFLESLSDEDVLSVTCVLDSLVGAYDGECLLDFIESGDFNNLSGRYEEYIAKQSRQSDMFKFWSLYIYLVKVLLNFIRATRQSDWSLHLSSLRHMLPWFFAFDRVNYARYGSVYWMEMMQLPTSHPHFDMSLLESGNWTVQRQKEQCFAAIACDQAIEQTCNRDSKTKGGLTGITLNRGASQRWILSQPERAAITRRCEELCHVTSDTRLRKDLDSTRKQRDERDVTVVISTFEDMVNPFGGQEDLINVSTGVIADEDIKTDLLTAEERGNSCFEDFVNKRLISKTEDFYGPLKSMKLKTFSDNKKVMKKKSSSGKDVFLKSDQKFFQRLMVISQNRELDLKDILTYSLGPVSYPLANSAGSLAKTNKSALLNLLVRKCDDSIVNDENFQCGAILIDAMALIQAIVKVPNTFGELADRIFGQMFNLAKHYRCERVDFVCDTYQKISIKNSERLRRTGGGYQKIQISNKEQRTPKQWKKFLSDGDNKTALLEFLFTVWRDIDGTAFDRDLEVFIAHGANCHLLSIVDRSVVVSNVDELYTDHEEADTRLLLHAKHAAEKHKAVVIKSPDTDVAVISLCLKAHIPAALYFMTGVKDKFRLLSIDNMCEQLGSDICEALIGIHCFSGCDSTSSFYGKGKVKMFDVMSKNKTFLKLMSNIGNSLENLKDAMPIVEEFVCSVYGINTTKSVNEVRHKLFCTKNASEQNMPPTSDSLFQHFLRVCYQAFIHKKSLQPIMDIPEPVRYGWKIEQGILDVIWMTKDPAPKDLLENISCKCKSGCVTGRCVCVKGKMKCTLLCGCVNCKNEKESESEIDEVDDILVDEGESDSDESDLDF